MLSSEFSGETKIKYSEAIRNAESFLNNIGYKDMKESYYFTDDGICTINFAYTQNTAVCYSDLIKISVALDKGEIVSVDCTGFLMNHKSRNMPERVIDEESAKRNISANLNCKRSQIVFIPMSDGSEVFAYEFFCSDKDGNDVLVYIDAQTGKEADIQLLLYSDSGTLTR
jgi:germination protein YpeB